MNFEEHNDLVADLEAERCPDTEDDAEIIVWAILKGAAMICTEIAWLRSTVGVLGNIVFDEH